MAHAGSRFITSDTHFHHANIIRYCARPFKDVDEMDAQMVELWNQTVRPNDEVYHLGDFYWIRGDNWFAAEQLLRRLNGRIHLIHGDHDPGLPQFERAGFGRIFTSMSYWAVVDRVLLIHDYENREPLIRQTGRETGASGAFPKGYLPYDIAFCGHVHKIWLHSNVTRAGGVALNVGVDLWAYRPVLWEQAVACQTDWLDYCRQSSRTPGDVPDA